MREKRKREPAPRRDPDDAPDLSTPYWREKFAKAPVETGLSARQVLARLRDRTRK